MDLVQENAFTGIEWRQGGGPWMLVFGQNRPILSRTPTAPASRGRRILRPYGRAADPGTIRGNSARELPENLPRAPLKSSKMGVKMVDFRTVLEPKVTRSHQSGALRGPRHPQRAPRRAQELPYGTQSGLRDPSRVPKGPTTVPLGRHWAPFGRLWGGFG